MFEKYRQNAALFYFSVLYFNFAFMHVFLFFPQRDTSSSPQFSMRLVTLLLLVWTWEIIGQIWQKPVKEMNTHSFISESHWALLNL